MGRMDGKRPLPPNDPEKKEVVQSFLSCTSARADNELSAMVSALTYVISSSYQARKGEGGGEGKTATIEAQNLVVLGSGAREICQPFEEHGIIASHCTTYFYLPFSIYKWPLMVFFFPFSFCCLLTRKYK